MRFKPYEGEPERGIVSLFLGRQENLHYEIEGSAIRFWYLHHYTGPTSIDSIACKHTSELGTDDGWLLLDGAKLFASKNACEERLPRTNPLPKKPPGTDNVAAGEWCWMFL